MDEHDSIEILDNPKILEKDHELPFHLFYIEIALIVAFTILTFSGISILSLPVFGLLVLLYGVIAPFSKPQFTKGNSLKIGLSCWNIINLLVLSVAIVLRIQTYSFSIELFILSLSSISLYYLSLPFVESKKIGSLRFFSILIFSLGFAVFFIGVLFLLMGWSIGQPLVLMGPPIVGIATVLISYQLLKSPKEHAYYAFYFPRIIALLVSYFLA